MLATRQMEAISLISPDYQVFDGSDSKLNCTQLDHMQWSYNGGVMLLGAATMWNQVCSPTRPISTFRVDPCD